MNEFEKIVQKNLITVVNYLPNHVDIWNTKLKEISKPLQVLSNQCEQLNHVQNANMKWIENFEEIKCCLLYRISNEIHETLTEIKSTILKLPLQGVRFAEGAESHS
ncbi:hypothetical protein HHI36_019369 [Cryptolaemus montrouzieri]|uniref:Uncharacterized protein n=1 Tax=Cryptolaemus montrouzieri TaxID=559131 RepID=A0ABD2P2P6_9CUCU